MFHKISKLFAITLIGFVISITNATAQNRAYTVNDTQVQSLLNRIETRTDTFKRNMGAALDRSSLNNTNSEDMIMNYITEFENATDSLKQRFDARRSVSRDVEDVLYRAAFINQFLQANRLNATVQRNWTVLRSDLTTLARFYNVSWNWNTPISNNTTTRPYRVTDSSVQTLLARIETNTDTYRRTLERSLDRSQLNNTSAENNIMQFVNDFEMQTDELKRKFDSRTSIGTDVSDLLNRAAYIERFMRNNRLNAATQRNWQTLRNYLNTLATYYSVSWNWNNLPTQNQNSRMDLNGTYRLNVSQSENVNTIVTNATNRYYTGNQRDRVRQNLERRLSPPDMLMIERVGQQVTVGSNLSEQVTFSADGRTQTETNNNGRTVRITANQESSGVAINYEGDRMNDFYVSFIPLNNGQLRVTRRVYLENRNETVTVTSVYDKTYPTAQWSTIDNNQNGNVTADRFIVPNNTQMTAVLQNMVSTKVSQDGDRFTMRVNSPSQYQGAIIEGYIAKTERSGRVTGRANVNLVFETIRLRNGQIYRFAGLVQEVRPANGETVSVNNEGSVRDNSQTNKTVTRGAIGAGIGAIIGAIAGGGKGAAIGAVVGGSAGAGSVLIQGRDDVELDTGTEFRLTATAPNNLNSVR